MAPTMTSLSFNSPISDSGTLELAHSSETWSMRLSLRAGKISSYWRHSAPRVFFQSMFSTMP